MLVKLSGLLAIAVCELAGTTTADELNEGEALICDEEAIELGVDEDTMTVLDTGVADDGGAGAGEGVK